MTAHCGKHDGRLTEAIEGINVCAALELRAKGRRVALPGGLFPLGRHLVPLFMPPNAI
jgi:hypothetical protein